MVRNLKLVNSGREEVDSDLDGADIQLQMDSGGKLIIPGRCSLRTLKVRSVYVHMAVVDSDLDGAEIQPQMDSGGKLIIQVGFLCEHSKSISSSSHGSGRQRP